MIALVILGVAAGKNSYRCIRRWAKHNEKTLGKYLSLSGGIPSVATISRIMGSIDQELFVDLFTDWMSRIINTGGRHISVDGKGLCATALKVYGQRTPYILNAVDVETALVVGELPIPEKKNEISSIPMLLETLNLNKSLVTIDAIGTNKTIIGVIKELGGNFLLQVKHNNPELYAEIARLFETLNSERDNEPEEFKKNYGDNYDMYENSEVNRERHEYRKCECYREKEEIKAFKQKISYIECVGQLTSVRINIARDKAGNDVSPDLAEVMRSTKGSDEADSAVQKIGIITDCVMDAMTMADYKRKHWTVENSLHYILDDTYDEDHSTIRRAKTGMTVVRKIAYNIIRLLMLKTGIKKFREVYDEVTADWEIATDYIFKPVPSI